MHDYSVLVIDPKGIFRKSYDVYDVDGVLRFQMRKYLSLLKVSYSLFDVNGQVLIYIEKPSMWEGNYILRTTDKDLATVEVHALNRFVSINSIYGKYRIEQKGFSAKEFRMYSVGTLDEVGIYSVKPFRSHNNLAVAYRSDFSDEIMATLGVLIWEVRSANNG